MCALHCAQLLHIILYRTDLIVFRPFNIHTIIITLMMTIWEKGRSGKSTGLLCCYRILHSHTVLTHEKTVQHRKITSITTTITTTSGYATMVHGRRCNPHRCTTTFANLEITSLWRHNSESIRDRQRDRLAPWNLLSYPTVKTASPYDNFCKTGNDVIYDAIIWVQDGNCKKWLEIILVLLCSTI